MCVFEPFVVLLDRLGQAQWVSRGESGVPGSQLLGTTMWDWTIPEDRRLAQRNFADCLLYGAPQDFTVTVEVYGRHVMQRVKLEVTGGDRLPVAVKSRAVDPRISQLTPRQLDVLRLIAKGHSRKRVARMLGIGLSTVEGHCAAACERLRIDDPIALSVFSMLHLAHD